MSRLEEVGDRDGWRCWLCDEPVDASMPSNDSRSASVDSVTTAAKSAKKAKAGAAQVERLAHRGCNTRKGAVKPVVPWPDRLLVAEPAPLIGVADRLGRKGGREVVARCPSADDAREAAAWVEDRFSRLAPDLPVTASVDSGGGQFLIVLTAG